MVSEQMGYIFNNSFDQHAVAIARAVGCPPVLPGRIETKPGTAGFRTEIRPRNTLYATHLYGAENAIGHCGF